MKKNILSIAAVALLALTSCGGNQKAAQSENTPNLDGIITKGEMVVDTLDGFILHTYQSNDAMADASFIVESSDALVLMEMPLFKDNASEFNTYVEALGKPVSKVISDYHLGGSEGHKLTMPEGMPAFIEGPIYSGMMQGFAQTFGDAIVEIPQGEKEEIAFDQPMEIASVQYVLHHGAETDFPGASIIIGGQVYLSHWAPSQSHASNLQVGSLAAVDTEIAELTRELNSGCKVFVGGHGGKTTREGVEFRKTYLTKVKELAAENKIAENFATALKAAYPNLALEENVEAFAAALYQK